jgi:UDP-2,3-diacylglucosamine hydrolase
MCPRICVTDNFDIQNFYKQQGQDFAAFFLSDIHLRQDKLEDIKRLEKFVEHLLHNNLKADLYFLGDIFDFWFCKASPVKKETQNLLKSLSHYNKIHGKVVFFEGNHDVHLYNSLTLEYGFEVVPERKIITLDSKKIILEHGDFFNPKDKNYLLLRKFLRQGWMKFLGLRIVPAFITAAIGNFFSHKSSKTTKVRSAEKTARIKNTFLKYAEKQLHQYQGDVFIAGHTHERLIHQDKEKLVINTGSWFDQQLVLSYSKSSEFMFLKI